MRSVVIAIVALLVLAGAFAVFMLLQPYPAIVSTTGGSNQGAYRESPPPPPSPTTQQAESVIGEASGVWIQSFDKATGDLVSEFKAARYDPPVQGTVHVVKPEARFYMKDDQVLSVQAEGGEVVMPEQTRRTENLSSIDAQPPTRGVLNNVTISMLKDADATEPSMVVSIPVLAFDNETLRMNTVQTTIDGRDVLADRVPVKVTGQYEFEGEGLIVRYNQRDQRLEYLEVTHGKRLVVKDVNTFGPTPRKRERPAASSRWLDRDEPPRQFAVNDKEAAAKAAAEEKARRERKRRRAAATQPAAQESKEIVAYRALFENDVKLAEGDRQVGSADRMLATFTFLDGAPAPAATRPAQPTTRRSRPTTAPTSQPNAAPVTQPAAAVPPPAPVQQGPVSITWTGKLVVTPVDFEKSGLRSAVDRVIEFVGSPVKLERDGALIEAASVSVGSVGDRFVARSSEQIPVVTLQDPAGMLLKTMAVDFSGDKAIVQGQSSVELVMTPDGKQQPPQKLTTTWRDNATLRLVTDAAGHRVIDQASFHGAVDVRHPQLKLNSSSLDLSFKPVAGKTQPVLTGAAARGNVFAVVTDEQGGAQTISTDQLNLATQQQPDGSLLLNEMTATGNVVAQDAKQKITADKLNAKMSRVDGAVDAKGSPKFDVEQMTAEGKVGFTAVDGATASADMITVRRNGPEGQLIELMGDDASLKQNQDSQLAGRLIRFDTATGNVSVVGRGSVIGLVRANEPAAAAAAQAKATPVEVTWSRRLEYRAADDTAEVEGEVKIVSMGKEGAIEQATGRKLTLLLADDPKKPANGGAEKPALANGSKIVKSIKLEGDPAVADGDGDVEVSSMLYSAAKQPLRRVVVRAPQVNVEVQPDGALGKVTINSAGRMLYEDLQQPAAATQPATAPAVTAPATQPGGGGVGGIKGKIAIGWSRSMVFDPATRRATLEGEVKVLQREPGRPQLQMNAERLIAELGEGAEGQPMQLKRVVADKGAEFVTDRIRFVASEAVYDPVADRMIARGSERDPVWLFDETKASSSSFEEVWWNIKEGRPERLKNVTANLRN